MVATDEIAIWQWVLVLVSGSLLLLISPLAKTAGEFFKATGKGQHQPGLWLLTGSLVISWIFAKSITNAANLGLKYGIVGGVAYATYYLSFLFAGIIIYQLRVRGRFSSIHEFLQTSYGRASTVLFSVLIGFRLFNEVWSNTMVIGSYFGDTGSSPYYLAVVMFTILTLAYSLKGGLKSSLMTDGIQMVLFGCLLILILVAILPDRPSGASLFEGSWTLTGGLDLLLVALIQVFSYPFHDPVMTDRGFITDAKRMRKAFFIAVPIGFLAIVLFSLIGVHARQIGLTGQAAVEVGKTMGVVTMLALNFIMITSASSTLDSAFSSFSKLVVKDHTILKESLVSGRLVMVIVALAGTVPVFFSPEILSATTVSGTMVIGLAPVFIHWKQKAGPFAFMLSVGTGIVFGTWYALGLYPPSLVFTEGSYGALLSVNLIGSVACFIAFYIGKWMKR
ncbi:MAG: sodium:solute symporter [Cyclobacteriaceae bacterium]